jgi:hypothetical protein
MAYPKLPEKAQRELDNIEREYFFFIHTHQYLKAQKIITDLFNTMLSWQKEYGQRFHKGLPIHNIGYALYLQNKHDKALKYFILAYIEDLLSTESPEEADVTPAGQTLLLRYKLSPDLLLPLKQIVAERKKQNKIPLHPAEVLEELEESKPGYYEEDIEDKKVEPEEHHSRKFTVFDSEWAERVFIGGSGGLSPIIEYMRNMVEKLGYDPVVAEDFDMPKGMSIYHKCLLLLHSCKYAIFDLSEQAGQLLEVERATEYGVKMLIVWPVNKEESITQMLKSSLDRRGIKYKAYMKFEEMENIFRDFLKGG